VEARADRWDVGRERLRCDSCGLSWDVGDNGRLAGDGGGDSGLASHHTEGVGELELAGLRVGVDRRLMMLGSNSFQFEMETKLTD
jgi:hypothetical protein